MIHSEKQIRRMVARAFTWLRAINEDRRVNYELPAKVLMRCYRRQLEKQGIKVIF